MLSPDTRLRLGGWSDADRVRVARFEAIELAVGGLFPDSPTAGP